MRILGFSKKWDKLKQAEFTTFRFPRRDRDWQRADTVQVFYKPRSKEREKLGIAEIINIELRKLGTAFKKYEITEDEAIADGFKNLMEMNRFFAETHGRRVFSQPINKLTLRWVSG